MRYAFLTADGLLLPVAYHLQEAGNEVHVGQIQNWDEVKMVRSPDPKGEERRLSLYQGMLENPWKARHLVEFLERQSPNDWFVFCDFNFFYDYADRLRRKGFKGLLPNKEDGRLEKDRDHAKEFVERNYNHVTVAEHQVFKTVQDAEKYLDKKAEMLFVLKGNSDECPTVVPSLNDPQANRMLILDSLERFKKWYEKEGFSLEEKIEDAIEFTPEAIAFDGQVIGVNVDIEHKHLGSRGGPMEGCSLTLVMWQELESILYEYFLQPMEEIMLRPNELTIWDMSVFWSPSRKEFFFGEFCSDRPGYDAIFAEIASSGGVESFVEKLTYGETLGEDSPFGVAVRVFNKQRIDPKKGWQEMLLGNVTDPNVFAWDIRSEDEKIYTIGYDSNVYVVTGSGDTPDKAIDDVYKNDEHVVFDSGFSLEKHDWYDTKYAENILHRYKILKDLEL